MVESKSHSPPYPRLYLGFGWVRPRCPRGEQSQPVAHCRLSTHRHLLRRVSPAWTLVFCLCRPSQREFFSIHLLHQVWGVPSLNPGLLVGTQEPFCCFGDMLRCRKLSRCLSHPTGAGGFPGGRERREHKCPLPSDTTHLWFYHCPKPWSEQPTQGSFCTTIIYSLSTFYHFVLLL